MNEIIVNKFYNSLIIMDKYSEMLFNLRDIYNDKNKIREYALEILKIKEIEKLDYEELNGIQIDYYLSLINTDDLRLKRIRGILLNRKWMLLNDKDKIRHEEFEMIDSIMSHDKINKKAYEMIIHEDDYEDINYREFLLFRNMLGIIYDAISYPLVEELVLKNSFDIDKTRLEFYGYGRKISKMYQDMFYIRAITNIKMLEIISRKEASQDKRYLIFSHLAMIEEEIDYLSKNNLTKLNSHISELEIDKFNALIVRRLIRKKEKNNL